MINAINLQYHLATPLATLNFAQQKELHMQQVRQFADTLQQMTGAHAQNQSQSLGDRLLPSLIALRSAAARAEIAIMDNMLNPEKATSLGGINELFELERTVKYRREVINKSIEGLFHLWQISV